MRKKRGYASLAAMSALALGLTACSDMPERDGKDPDASTNKGSINGSGASSQVNAQQAWRDNYSASSGFTINYDPTGSGTGREQFIAGKTAFAGTDSVLNPEEVAAATSRCNGTEPLELPLYISPIALAFNLDGITSLNLTADLIAHIFNGTITTWNDPKLRPSIRASNYQKFRSFQLIAQMILAPPRISKSTWLRQPERRGRINQRRRGQFLEHNRRKRHLAL
ncbi:Phosphate-binding protein pstS 2 precursor [Arcanobacterium haemolyticum]|nr:Phosphate-binding protein pstS 2 precursor [Arcanobacterium haemolyticum]